MCTSHFYCLTHKKQKNKKQTHLVNIQQQQQQNLSTDLYSTKSVESIRIRSHSTLSDRSPSIALDRTQFDRIRIPATSAD